TARIRGLAGGAGAVPVQSLSAPEPDRGRPSSTTGRPSLPAWSGSGRSSSWSRTPRRLRRSGRGLEEGRTQRCTGWGPRARPWCRAKPGWRPRQVIEGEFSERYLSAPPAERQAGEAWVFRRGDQVVVKPGGFLLRQTKKEVGTPRGNRTDSAVGT